MFYSSPRRCPVLVSLLICAGHMLPNCAFAESFSVTVVSVARGDILEIEHDATIELVQIYGIECPASASELGKAAKAFTEQAVLGKTVRVEIRKRQAQLTYISVIEDGKPSLAQQLLKRGLAERDRFAAPDAAELDVVEHEARANAIGIWAERLPPTLSERVEAAARALGDFKKRRELAHRADFELSYSLWRSMPEEERERLRAASRRSIESRRHEDSQRIQQSEERVSSLGARQTESQRGVEELRDLLEALALREARALQAARDDEVLRDDEQILRTLKSGWQESLRLEELEIRNQYDRYQRTREYETRVEERRRAMDAEVAAVEENFARQRQELLGSVSMAEAERAALTEQYAGAALARRHSENLARTRAERNRTRQSRIEALDRALAEEYQPALQARTLGTWSGSDQQETEAFTVRTGVWAVDLNATDEPGKRDIIVDVFSMDDQQIVTRITNDSPRYMNFRVIETPGVFYLKIRSRRGLNYAVRAIVFQGN